LKSLGILKSSKYAALYDHLVNIASSRKGQHADLLAALQEIGLSDADAFEYLTCNDKDFVKIVDKFLLKMACTKFYSMWDKVLGPDADTSATRFYQDYRVAKELAQEVLVEGGAEAASAGAGTTRAAAKDGASVHSSVRSETSAVLIAQLQSEAAKLAEENRRILAEMQRRLDAFDERKPAGGVFGAENAGALVFPPPTNIPAATAQPRNDERSVSPISTVSPVRPSKNGGENDSLGSVFRLPKKLTVAETAESRKRRELAILSGRAGIGASVQAMNNSEKFLNPSKVAELLGLLPSALVPSGPPEPSALDPVALDPVPLGPAAAESCAPATLNPEVSAPLVPPPGAITCSGSTAAGGMPTGPGTGAALVLASALLITCV
jgi:hypothetical protein